MKLNYYKTIKIITLGLFIITIIGFCITNKAYAVAKHDCNIPKLTTKYPEIYPQEAINKALINLHGYCCGEGKILDKENKICKDNEKLNYINGPSSPFLFDHLIDVGLRRLDAKDNYTYTNNTDKTGKEWVDKVKDIVDTTKGELPNKILTLYKQYWTLKPENELGVKHLKTDLFSTEENGVLKNYIDNYNQVDQVTLADKYNNICLIARNLYEKSTLLEKVLIGTDRVSKNRSYYNDCQKMVAIKIKQENLYVRSLLITKSDMVLETNINKILSLDFVQDKLAKLQDLISQIVNLFTTEVNQSEGVVCKKCTQ